jgi:hypothetical protein
MLLVDKIIPLILVAGLDKLATMIYVVRSEIPLRLEQSMGIPETRNLRLSPHDPAEK